MLNVSDKSLAAHKSAQRELNRDRYRSYLQERFPDHSNTRTVEALDHVIGHAHQIVDHFNLIEDSVAMICDLIVMYGPDFWKEAWADVLHMPGLSGEERYTILRRRCLKQLNYS